MVAAAAVAMAVVSSATYQPLATSVALLTAGVSLMLIVCVLPMYFGALCPSLPILQGLMQAATDTDWARAMTMTATDWCAYQGRLVARLKIVLELRKQKRQQQQHDAVEPEVVALPQAQRSVYAAALLNGGDGVVPERCLDPETLWRWWPSLMTSIRRWVLHLLHHVCMIAIECNLLRDAGLFSLGYVLTSYHCSSTVGLTCLLLVSTATLSDAFWNHHLIDDFKMLVGGVLVMPKHMRLCGMGAVACPVSFVCRASSGERRWSRENAHFVRTLYLPRKV
jgi:hypothetical protein